MTTEKNKVLDEMMDIWDTLEIVKRDYIPYGINIEELYPMETQRFLSYIRFDKQCIIMKNKQDIHRNIDEINITLREIDNMLNMEDIVNLVIYFSVCCIILILYICRNQ